MPKVIFCTPFVQRPTVPFLKALEECLPAIESAGWEHGLAQRQGNPYISNARADMTRYALDAGADVIMYLDYDVSWQPRDMLRILATTAPVVAGLYRFKKDEVEYMGSFTDIAPVVNSEGLIRAHMAPAGFLKVTKEAISAFARKYPELLFGDPMKPHIDLFNHGAIDGVWYGEDYAFCKRWREAGYELWVCPDMDISHHGSDGQVYPGNFHKYMLKERGAA